MPQTKEIEISYGMTINTGNYESERVDLSMRVTLEANDEEDKVVDDYLFYIKGKCKTIRDEIITRRAG